VPAFRRAVAWIELGTLCIVQAQTIGSDAMRRRSRQPSVVHPLSGVRSGRLYVESVRPANMPTEGRCSHWRRRPSISPGRSNSLSRGNRRMP